MYQPNPKLEQLRAQQERDRKKLEQFQHREQRLQNRIHYLESAERQQRNHRLITRGAAIESVAPQTKNLSETAFYAFAEEVFALPDTQRLLTEVISNHAGGD